MDTNSNNTDINTNTKNNNININNNNSSKEEEIERSISLSEIAEATDPGLLRIEGHTTLSEAYRKSLDAEYPNLKLTPAGAARVKGFLQNMRLGGAAGVLLICAGDNCQLNQACPLYLEKAHPEGQTCPLEAMVVMDTRNELSKLVDVDTDNPITKGYINELIQIAVLIWRCQMHMAYDYHDVLKEVPAAISPDGVVHTKPEESPLIDTLDKLSHRRSRLLKELALTEDAKWRKEAAVGSHEKDSLSRIQAARKAQIQDILPSMIKPPSHVNLIADKPQRSDNDT